MILATHKFTFKETITVDLPGGSIPVEIKASNSLLTLFYWEGNLSPRTYKFRLFKKGSSINPDELISLKRLGSSIWFTKLWWQVYEEL